MQYETLEGDSLDRFNKKVPMNTYPKLLGFEIQGEQISKISHSTILGKKHKGLCNNFKIKQMKIQLLGLFSSYLVLKK